MKTRSGRGKNRVEEQGGRRWREEEGSVNTSIEKGIKK